MTTKGSAESLPDVPPFLNVTLGKSLLNTRPGDTDPWTDSVIRRRLWDVSSPGILPARFITSLMVER